MGSSTSKAAKQTVGAAARKYPARPSPSSQATSNAPPRQPPPAQNRQPGPTVRPQAYASETRDEGMSSCHPRLNRTLTLSSDKPRRHRPRLRALPPHSRRRPTQPNPQPLIHVPASAESKQPFTSQRDAVDAGPAHESSALGARREE